VRIGLACGLDPIIHTMHVLGVNADVDAQPAMLLGAVGIPPIEMADAYSTIARIGSRVPLRTIRFVTDDRNRMVATGGNITPVQVFPARDMYVLVNIMKGVVDRGTAAGARALGFRQIAAGKTGTTNDKRDAWFIGFTPRVLTLTWVGFDDNAPTGLSGAQGAVPIWTRYMEAVAGTQPNADFPAPSGIDMVQVDESSGGLATPNCPQNVVVTEAFKSGTQPTIPCPLHSPQAQPMPAVDQFGNPISIDTTGPPPTDTNGMAVPPPTDTTLTGGIFKTDTAPPPTATAPPPPTTTRERERPLPPTTTTTSEPPPTSTTSTTSTSTATDTTGTQRPPQ
jgi:membrane carboxypeptidase/penicillin-binding protein